MTDSPKPPPLGSISVEGLWEMIRERDGLILMQSQKIETLESTVSHLQTENLKLKQAAQTIKSTPKIERIMEDIPKDFCYLTHHVDKQKRFECKICGLFLSTKQRILTHLNKKHNKSPLKRVYKQYEDDPSIPVPKRTAMRHSSARQIFSVSSSQCSSAMSDKDHDNTINNENAYEFGNQIEDENFTCNLQDTVFSDSDTQSDLSTESYGIDSSESEIDSSESDLELCDFELSDNDQYENEMSCNDLDRSLYSETEMEALCIASYFLRHNLSGVAIQDLLNLLKVSCTDSDKFREITYDKVLSLAGNANFKTVDYCSVCCQRFPEDPDLFRCETHGCTGLRYKGQLSAQQGASRQPRNSFVIGDLEKQFKLVLERKGSWKSIQDTKMRVQSRGKWRNC